MNVSSSDEGECECVIIIKKNKKNISKRATMTTIPPSPPLQEENEKDEKDEISGGESKPKTMKSRSQMKTKTKKNNKTMSNADKIKLWDIFDTDKQELTCCDDTPPPITPPQSQDFCEKCGSIYVMTDDGFFTCSNMKCSVINKNILDFSPEWRYYGAEDKNTNDPTRCGNPINPLLVESSFGCKILCDNKSSYEMKKIRKWTEWISMPHREKSLYDEFQFINNMAQNAGIPKIFIDHAMTIHKDISAQKMFRGMNRDSIKSASIYISCRLNGCPRTAYEIAEIFKLDKASATNGCSVAVNILQNIERNLEHSQKTELGTTTPSSFIERFCSKLNVSPELTMLAKFIAIKVEENNIICDNTPHAVASGIIYLISNICNLNILKNNIRTICGVSEVTINKCYKKLFIIKEQIIPECILKKYAAAAAAVDAASDDTATTTTIFG